jgi:hypothetical protein
MRIPLPIILPAPTRLYRVLLAVVLGTSLVSHAADSARSFTTPEEAATALVAAAKAQDRQGMQALFGPVIEALVNPDRVQATNEFANFSTAFDQTHRNVQARLDLWKKYQRKIAKAVSPARAAQFLQVEHQIALFMDLNIAADMPALRMVIKTGQP